jgi:hypothetical protein
LSEITIFFLGDPKLIYSARQSTSDLREFFGGIMVCELKKVVADLSIDVFIPCSAVSSLSNMKKAIIDVP